MGRWVKRTHAPEVIKRTTLSVYFRPDPFDACLGKGDEIKSSQEQFREVLLGIIAVVSDYLRGPDAQSRQLVYGIGDRCHIREVAGLLCEGNGLPALYGIKCQQLYCLESIVSLVESISGFVLVLGISGYVDES